MAAAPASIQPLTVAMSAALGRGFSSGGGMTLSSSAVIRSKSSEAAGCFGLTCVRASFSRFSTKLKPPSLVPSCPWQR